MSLTRIALCAAVALGCKSTPYLCTSSTQCVQGENVGVCTQDYCAFADPACPGGYRFEPNAGDDLGGTCTGEVKSDCGAIGQPCCEGDNKCVGGASCSSGTCQSCVVDVAPGRRFSCILDKNKAVWCSGDNAAGQLGAGMISVPKASRTQVRDSTNALVNDASTFSAGNEHACAIRAGGSVWCWGRNNTGQIGDGTTSAAVSLATQVIANGNSPLSNIVEVVAGRDHTCARDSTGGVWCWGRNDYGQLGDGTTTQRSTAAPVLVAMGGAPLTGATGLLVGAHSTCALKANLEAWCWGKNDNAELGDGTTNNRLVPFKMVTASSVALGQYYTCFVNDDTTVSCQGWGGQGRLGLGGEGGRWDNTYHVTPDHVKTAADGMTAFTGAKTVFAGGTSCVIRTDQSVACWGDDRYGETGTGAGSTWPVPVRFFDGTLLTNVDRLVVRYGHVCAHRASGDWSCWGRNAQGDLGDGMFMNYGYPVPLKASCP